MHQRRFRVAAVLATAALLATAAPALAVDDDSRAEIRAKRHAAGPLDLSSRPLARRADAELGRLVRAGLRGETADVTARYGAPGVAAREVALTVVSPAEGATVSGVALVEIAVTDAANQVRVAVPGSTEQVVAVDDPEGHVTVGVPTYGLSGEQPITVTEAMDGTPGASVVRNVVVDNGAPILVKPSPGQVVSGSIVARANPGGGTVRYRIDGVEVASLPAGADATLDTTGLSEGVHHVTAVSCTLDGTICDTAHPSAAVAFEVDHTLVPAITSVTPKAFSPGTDGRFDTTKVGYSLDGPQVVSWKILRGSTLIRGPIAIGPRAAGSYAFVWDGKNNGGGYVADATYTIVLTGKRTIDGQLKSVDSQAAVRVDRAGAAATARNQSWPTVYPVRDGYRETVTFTARFAEALVWSKFTVRNSSGRLVKSWSAGGLAPGQQRGHVWTARYDSGALLPAGSYTWRIETQDAVGNRWTSPARAIAVSHKKLKAYAGTRTVTAEGTLRYAVRGDCSDIAIPGARSWDNSYALLSNIYVYDDGPMGDVCWQSTDPYYDEIIGAHSTWLVPAVRYSNIRISVYGGKSLNAYNDTAVMGYFDNTGYAVDFTDPLSYPVGWHAGRVLGSRFVRPDGIIRWWVGTADSNWYDVGKFTVKYTYWRLA